jgi:hypothetical protein
MIRMFAYDINSFPLFVRLRHSRVNDREAPDEPMPRSTRGWMMKGGSAFDEARLARYLAGL